jgi:hypothetical protein
MKAFDNFLKYLNRINNRKLRTFSKISKDKEGDICTSLFRPNTNFSSRRLKIRNIIFTKRVNILKPNKIVELTSLFLKNELQKSESINLYIYDEVATVVFEQSKINFNIITFNSSNPYFSKISKKHLEKIYIQKELIKLKKIDTTTNKVIEDFKLSQSNSNVIDFG